MLVEHEQSSRTKAGSGIRSCRRGDLPQVTEMYRQVFCEGEPTSDDSWRSYLEQVYFDNPWADDEFPSLVAEQNGVISGFLGVIPKWMQYRGETIRVAVSSALMVRIEDSGKRNPITGVSLLRRFLDGEQDLSLTDTANEVTRGIWTSCGGSIAFPYSYSWIRPLRPLNSYLEMSVSSSLLRGIVKPICSFADSILRHLPPLKPSQPGCRVKEIDTARLLELLTALPPRALMPQYDLASLEWLLAMAAGNDEGELAKRVVESADGKALGWFVHYHNRNGFGRVLQVAAFPRSMETVLDGLIDDARQAGVAALWGRTEPLHAMLLTQRHCLFQARPWVLVHSSRPEIIHSFQNADAFFSGLDGELWMKFNT